MPPPAPPSPRARRDIHRPSPAPSPASHPDAESTSSTAPESTPPRLLDRLRIAIRTRHYSIRTEDTYVDWARRYIIFHNKRHPAEMGAAEVAAFLSHLAVDRGVAAPTQNQAKSALLFLYRHVIDVQLPWLDEIIAAKDQRRLPVVLTPTETRTLLNGMSGTTSIVASLLYGTGMRLLESLRLWVKDVTFERREIVVRDGKGGKDRITILPENLMLPLQQQMSRAKALHQRDLADGLGRVWLPHALAVKYPHSAIAWGLAMDLPQRDDVDQSAFRRAPKAPPERSVGTEGGGRCRPAGSHRQAVLAAHPAPLVRDASASIGIRHPHGAGVAGPLRSDGPIAWQ